MDPKPSVEERREYWLRKYPTLRNRKFAGRKYLRVIPPDVLDQLDRCKSEEAQRLILGVSR